MEKIKQLLKDAGLDDTAINKVVDNGIKDRFVPKHRMDEINAKNKQLLEDVADRDKQIKELSKFEGDNAELKAKIEKLEQDNAAKDEANAKALRELKVDNAINNMLNGKVQTGYEDLVRGLIDKSSIVLKEDGSISGLEEQFNKIKESKSLLFVGEGSSDNSKDNNGWSFKGQDPAPGQAQGKKTVSENFVMSLLEDNKVASESCKAANDFYFGTK